MSKLIDDEIAILREEIKKISSYRDEYLFSLVCYKYFYNQGSLDFKDCRRCFVDGRDDGGIDLVTLVESETSTPSLVLIQSKSSKSLNAAGDLTAVFNKMDKTVRDFRERRTKDYNDKLKQILKERLSDIEDQSANIELVVFLGTELSDERRRKLDAELAASQTLADYNKTVWTLSEIENHIQSIKDPARAVKKANIRISHKDGVIHYGEDGLLVNILSDSLHDLYDMYKDAGLFEQNFRYFVTNKRIDTNIRESLKKHRKEFWYLNNGIIIGCKDFVLDGNKITLHDFSIINGCQTTTLIGEYKGGNENEAFLIPCKIVRSEKEDFISEIAQASNSQKPISDRDLRSNLPEQRKLKRELADHKPPVFMEIKRGETKVSKSKGQPWQFIKNEFLGQLILSFFLQQPGSARNNKQRIFAENKTYSAVFKRKHDLDTLVSLLKLHDAYREFANQHEASEPDETSVVDNGTFFVLAVIGFILKMKHGQLSVKDISKEAFEDILCADTLSGAIFKEPKSNDFDEILCGLFQKTVTLLLRAYKSKEKEEKTVSNFFKADTKYRDVMLRQIVQEIYSNNVELKDFQKKYLGIFA